MLSQVPQLQDARDPRKDPTMDAKETVANMRAQAAKAKARRTPTQCRATTPLLTFNSSLAENRPVGEGIRTTHLRCVRAYGHDGNHATDLDGVRHEFPR